MSGPVEEAPAPGAAPPTVPLGAYGTPTPPPTYPSEDPSVPAPPPPAPPEPRATPRPSAAAPRGPTVRIPSLARRVVVGSLLTLVLIFFLVVLPLALLSRLEHLPTVSLTFPVTRTEVAAYGTALAVLYGLRSVGRPTLAFGPLSVLVSGLGIAYLLFLAQAPPLTVGVRDISLSLGIGPWLVLLALVPLFGLLAGLVATVEDLARPGERVRVEYARRL